MTYIVEEHNQISINSIRNRLSDGWKTTFRRRGEVVQVLNALPRANGLYFEWRRHNHGNVLQQHVELISTQTNFGGSRVWFVCPLCKRRCGSLFDYGRSWLCRKCGNLKYRTASCSKSERIYERVSFLKSKANLDEYRGGLDYLFEFDRPKRMRFKTWSKICTEHNELIDEIQDYVLTRFGLQL